MQIWTLLISPINFVQQVFFLLSTEGSLVITRAYQPYTLVGPPVRGLVLDPLAVYSSRSMYSFWTFTNFAKNPNVECMDLV